MRPKPPPAVRVSGGRNTRFADAGGHAPDRPAMTRLGHCVSGITTKLTGPRTMRLRTKAPPFGAGPVQRLVYARHGHELMG